MISTANAPSFCLTGLSSVYTTTGYARWWFGSVIHINVSQVSTEISSGLQMYCQLSRAIPKWTDAMSTDDGDSHVKFWGNFCPTTMTTSTLA